MSRSVSERLQEHLKPGEELLYAGQPYGGFIWTWHDFVYLGFSLSFLVFALFSYVLLKAAAFEMLRPVFVLLGIYPLLRYLLGVRRRRNIIYGISRERVIIVARFPSKEVRILAFADMSSLVFKPWRKGYAGIRLIPARTHIPVLLYELEAIPEAEQVYRLLQKQLDMKKESLFL